MRDRIATLGPIAAVTAAVGLCCGLPILLSLGVAGAIAGWSLQSWALIGIGLVLAALGWARMVRGRRNATSCHRHGAAAPVDAATVQTTSSNTPISTDNTNRENHL